MDTYDDQEIAARYRLSKELMMGLYNTIGEELELSTLRNHAILGMLQIFIALRFAYLINAQYKLLIFQKFTSNQ